MMGQARTDLHATGFPAFRTQSLLGRRARSFHSAVLGFPKPAHPPDGVSTRSSSSRPRCPPP